MQFTRTVLCIDDDEDDRQMVCEAVGEIDASIEVIHASRGEEALEYLRKAKEEQKLPCLIMMDIRMPGMGGRDLILELEKDHVLAKIPRAVFSTFISPIDKEFFSAHGAETVRKPTDFETLLKVVEDILRKCA